MIMAKTISRRELLKTGLTAASLAAIRGGVTVLPALAQQQGELIIRNGLIVTDSGRMEADIRIRGEKIAEIGRNLDSTPGAREIDARRMFLIPGGVDTHTHPPSVAEPTPTECEHRRLHQRIRRSACRRRDHNLELHPDRTSGGCLCVCRTCHRTDPDNRHRRLLHTREYGK